MGAFRSKDDLVVRILEEPSGMQSGHVLAFPFADHDDMASGYDDRWELPCMDVVQAWFVSA